MLTTFQKLVVVFGTLIFGMALVGMIFGILAYLDTDTVSPEIRTITSAAGTEIPIAYDPDMVLVPKTLNTNEVEWTRRPHSHGTGKHRTVLKFENVTAPVPSSLHDYTVPKDTFVHIGDTLYVHTTGNGLTGGADQVELSVIQSGLPVAAGSFVVDGVGGHREWAFDFYFRYISSGVVQVSGHEHNLDNGVDARVTTISQQIAVNPLLSWTIEFIKQGAGAPIVHQALYEFLPSPT